MNRVLVYGLKDPVGGVEKVVLEYTKSMVAQFDITFDFLVFSENFSLESELNSLGCRVITLPVRRKDPAGYKAAINQIFQNNEYCAVWGNYSGLTNIDILTLAKQHNIPIRIAHSHVSQLYWGSPIMKYVVHFLHAYNKLRIDKYASHYFSCSNVSGRFMFPRKVYERIIPVHNAIDATRFKPDENTRNQMRENLGISPDTLVVGHVARLCEVKNQDFLLKIIAQFKKEQHNAKLLLIGDGELYEHLNNLAKELKIDDMVIFTGNRTDVAQLMQAMDVYVLTSFSEGLSVSAVEAQASGIPCVLSSAVSDETNISGAVKFVSLNDPLDVWTRTISQQGKARIENAQEKIKDAGYEISSAAKQLYNVLIGDVQ